VPSLIWLGLSIFVGGVLLGLRVMGTHWKVKEAHDDAKRKRDDIAAERESLRDAAEKDTNEAYREQLLKGIKK